MEAWQYSAAAEVAFLLPQAMDVRPTAEVAAAYRRILPASVDVSKPLRMQAQAGMMQKSRATSFAAVASMGFVVGVTFSWTHRSSRRRLLKRSHAARSASPVGGAQSAEPKVVLLGDSVLDNFFWLETPSKHLRTRLKEELGSSLDSTVAGLRPVNLAVDQMTTFDFEERTPAINPWDMYAEARCRVEFEDDEDRKYIMDKDGVIRSLKNLKSVENVQWAVLSIGGNDVYLNRNIQSSLALSVLPPFSGNRQEVANAFGERLRRIVKGIQQAAEGVKLVLVIPYHPHRDFSLVYGAPVNDQGEKISGDILGDFVRSLERLYLSELVTPMVSKILEVGRDLDCPVVDLSKTLDINVEEHYGTGCIGTTNSLGVPWSGAEPSDVSNQFIAELLVHAIKEGPRKVVYRGVPRRTGSEKWSLLIKEEANDSILAEDYRFGPTSGRTRVKTEDANGSNIAFLVGVVLAALANGWSLFSSGDALFFDRAAFEAELKAEFGSTGKEPALTGNISSKVAPADK